jgi:phosphatidylserine/phosphatidylglycerophosphate/cardiolipin synthase-like enzyme/uncharacterized membrane protein YdjX (TVP38/TMEM64 family)
MRVAHAERLALLVDGAEYFDAFVAAAERARRSIIIVGWDFDSRALLYRSSPERESRGARWKRRAKAVVRRRDSAAAGTVTLGNFLRRLTRRHRTLEVRVLIWDYPTLFGLDRDLPLYFGLGRRLPRRVKVRYDSTHPVGASHHQKIVVIDDAVGFSGGIDLTMRRWDTCDHRIDDARRVAFDKPYPPFHDCMMMVSGEAARALGDVARDRWERVTGERPPTATRRDAWPSSLEPDLTNVPVAVSRTIPPIDEHPGVREIEKLYLDMVAGARHTIYIENQFFTAERIGDALAGRLAEPAGPEVIAVLRRLSHGWLESLSMEALRTRLLHKLQRADRDGRFRFYYPDAVGLAKGTCIDVHSKVMVVDDAIVHIGSANFSNRSMGLDTECDLTVEAGDDANVRAAIARFRNRLVAEHLGVAPDELAEAHRQKGTLGGAIEHLRRDVERLERGERTLSEFGELTEIPEVLESVVELADLERPVSVTEMLPLFSSTQAGSVGERQSARWLSAIGMLLLGAAAWRWLPFERAAPVGFSGWLEALAASPWLALFLVLAYVPSGAYSVPRVPITLFAAAAMGPTAGFALALLGSLLAAGLSYGLGARMGPEALRARVGPGVSRMQRLLERHDIVGTAALRLRLFLPFATAGTVAGVMRIVWWRFAAGTIAGLLPGLGLSVALGHTLRAVADEAVDVNYWLLVASAIVLVAAAFVAQRWSSATERRSVTDRGLPASAV